MQQQSNSTTLATELLTVTQAAALVNKNKSTISRYVKDGLVPNLGSPRKPLVKLADVQLAINELVNGNKRRLSDAPAAAESLNTGTGEQQSEIMKSRLQKENLQNQLLQIKLGEAAGRLVSREAVERMLFTMARTARDRLLQLPKALADKLAHQDRDVIRATLAQEIEGALVTLAAELTVKPSGVSDDDDDFDGEEPEE